MKEKVNSIKIEHRHGLTNVTHLFDETSDFNTLLEALLTELQQEFHSAKSLFKSQLRDLRNTVENNTDYTIFKIFNYYRSEPEAYRNFVLDTRENKEVYDSKFIENTLTDFWRIFAMKYVNNSILSLKGGSETFRADMIALIEARFQGQESAEYNVQYEVDFSPAKEYFKTEHPIVYKNLVELGVIEFLDIRFSTETINKKIFVKENRNIKYY